MNRQLRLVAYLALVLVCALPWERSGAQAGDAAQFVVKGAALLRLGMPQADQYFARARELAPDDPAIALRLGQVLLKAGRETEAISDLERAQAVAPDDAVLAVQVGEVYLSGGLKERAVVAFERSAALAPDDPSVHYSIGRAYSDAGDHERAAKSLQRAADLLPDDPNVALALGLARFDLGELQAADRALGVVASGGESVMAERARFYRGRVAMELRDYPRALDLLTPPEAFAPALRPAAAYYAAVASLRARQRQRSEDYFEQSAAQGAGTTWERNAREALEQVRRSWSLRGDVGLSYDSNVLLLPDEEDIDPSLVVSEKDDFVVDLYGSGNYRVLARDHVEASVGYAFSQSLHHTLERFDEQRHTFSAEIDGYYWRVEPALEYQYDLVFLDRERFYSRHSVTPQVRFPAGGHADVTLYYVYRNTDRDDDDQRDAETHTFGVSTGIELSHRRSLRVGYAFGRHDARGDSLTGGDIFDYDSHTFSGALYTPFLFGFDAALRGTFVFQGYDNVDTRFPGLGKRRNERFVVGAVELSRPLGRYLDARLSYEYTRNDGNIAVFNYSRNVLGVTLIATY